MLLVYQGNSGISIHPPLAGRDLNDIECGYAVSISIHPPLAGRDAFFFCVVEISRISIHPPLAGRDKKLVQAKYTVADFNPPAPCGAGRSGRLLRRGRRDFNPPAPCGAGRRRSRGRADRGHFNPPAPCGAGRLRRQRLRAHFISIHPPLAGRDSDLAQKNCAKHRILHKKCIYPGRIERFSGSDAAIFLPNVHKFRCEPSEESLLTPRSHAYTIRTPSG